MDKCFVIFFLSIIVISTDNHNNTESSDQQTSSENHTNCSFTINDVFSAINSNNMDLLTKILTYNSALAREKSNSNNGISPLHLAVLKNNVEAIILLYAAGADLKSITDNGFTPLFWAIARDNLEAVKTLISLDKSVINTCMGQISPLHWACLFNATNCLKELIRNDADLYAKSENHLLPIHWALKSSSFESELITAEAMAIKEISEQKMIPEYILLSLVDQTKPFTHTNMKKNFILKLNSKQYLSLIYIPQLNIWVSKYEISNAQFRLFKPHHNSGMFFNISLNEPDQPAVNVSWYDAIMFCHWLNTNFSSLIPKNYIFRLPTIKEWRFISSCGKNRIFPWGNNLPPAYGNYADIEYFKFCRNCKIPFLNALTNYSDGVIVSSSIYNCITNELEIAGLAGNVWEWCVDSYEKNPEFKVKVGGGWDFSTEEDIKISYISFDHYLSGSDSTGFRVVLGPFKAE